MTKRKLIYVFAFRSSFISKDEILLKSSFEVVSLFFNPLPRWKTPISLIVQLFQLIRHLPNSQAVVCQFAGFHTVLPVLMGRLFRKKVYLILLGAECHNYPGIQHGNFRKKILAAATRLSFRWAHKLLPIHQSLAKFENNYDPSEPRHQGFLSLVPELKTPYKVIPHGFDDALFNPKTSAYRKPKSFITAASSVAPPVFQRKGIDLFIEMARRFPDCSFSLLCKNDYLNLNELPKNLTVLEAVPYDKLASLFASHQFYMQVSIAEGLPNALCEAMLCGCVPIGSDVFAIPEIIGDAGFVCRNKNAEALVLTIQNALDADFDNLSVKARNRIQEKFPLKIRTELLIETINPHAFLPQKSTN